MMLTHLVILVCLGAMLVSEGAQSVVLNSVGKGHSASISFSSHPPLPEHFSEMHVSPSGSETSSICRTEARPCSLARGIQLSAPYTIIYLHGGVYYGEYHITKRLYFIAASPSETVTFDGQRESRPFWFDNVPAHIESVRFINGYGGGAGCVLVTLSREIFSEYNNFTADTFVNCTSTHPLPGTNAQAGALLIYYDIITTPRSFEISNSNFYRNYARSRDPSAGAVLIKFGELVYYYHLNPAGNDEPAPYFMSMDASRQYLKNYSGAQEHQHCQFYGIQMGDQRGQMKLLNDPNTDYLPLSGLYRRRNITLAGKPVWNRWQPFRKSNLQGVSVGYCVVHKTWTVSGAVPDAVYEPCEARMIQNAQSIPAVSPEYGTHWSEGSTPLTETRVFRCEDQGLVCDTFYLHLGPANQEMRSGIYEKLQNFTFAGRPAFIRMNPGLNGGMNHFMWYCQSLYEWVVSDDDPREINVTGTSTYQCLRGVTSEATLSSLHPIGINLWKAFDGNEWVEQSKSSVRFQCLPQIHELCDVLHLVNAPYTSDIRHQPYLLMKNFTWRGRPAYSTADHSYFLYFCGPLDEWIVTTVNPTSFNASLQQSYAFTETECSRVMAARGGQHFLTPEGPMTWMFLREGEWKRGFRGTEFVCVSNCSNFNIEFPAVGRGVYEAVGMRDGLNVYEQSTEPHLTLSYSVAYDLWVLRSYPVADDESLDSLYSTLLLAADGNNASHPFLATNWRARNEGTDEIQPTRHVHMICNMHQRCPLLKISNLPSNSPEIEQLAGFYHQSTELQGGRPVYYQVWNYSLLKTVEAGLHEATIGKKKSGKYKLFYCEPLSRWIVGPSQYNTPEMVESSLHCHVGLLSRATSVYSPQDYPLFDKVGAPPDKTSNLPFPADVICAYQSEPIPPHRFHVRNLKKRSSSLGYVGPLSDIIHNCTFTGNSGMTDSYVGVGGAVAIAFRRGTAAIPLYGVLRKLIIKKNEVLSVDPRVTNSAGGVGIFNNFMTPQLFYFFNVSIANNVGAVGGTTLHHVHASLSRCALVGNFGENSGGGFLVQHSSNVSFSYLQCSQNTAVVRGGCGVVKPTNYAHFSSTEFVENNALSGEGSILNGGDLVITDSKLHQAGKYAVASTVMSLSSSDVACHQGTAVTYKNGFGCIEEESTWAPGAIKSGTTPPRRSQVGQHSMNTMSTSVSHQQPGITVSERIEDPSWTSRLNKLCTLLIALCIGYFLLTRGHFGNLQQAAGKGTGGAKRG